MTIIIVPSAQRIAFLICSHLSGSITDFQSSELRTWIDEKKGNRLLFRLLNINFLYNAQDVNCLINIHKDKFTYSLINSIYDRTTGRYTR